MKATYMALWAQGLEQRARFWVSFFDGKINKKHRSEADPGFRSCSVKIGEGIATELVTKPGLIGQQPDSDRYGWVHLAISVGGNEDVDVITMQEQEQGILVSGPRIIDDGYYEAVIKDLDDNLVEIVA